MSAALDNIDRSLIRLLRLNGRRPNSELAEEVGLSPSACLRRIRLLEERDHFLAALRCIAADHMLDA